MTSDKIRVLFVCMGNICRSPAAEGLFIEHVRRAGHADRFHIDSAGTLDYHTGSLPDPRMQEVAARRGYALQSRARQVNKHDLEKFDLVLAMDQQNLDELQQLAGGPREHVRLFGSFLIPAGGIAPPVPDPYTGSMRDFEKVLDMIEAGSPAILEYCLGIHR